MPCNTDQGQDKWFEEQYGTNDPDKLREMLCRIMSEAVIVLSGKMVLDISDVDQDIQDWFSKHKKWDEGRKK